MAVSWIIRCMSPTIAEHLNIAAGTTISGGTTVMKSILNPGVYTSVFPLDTHEEWLRNASHIRRLSKLAERVSELEKKLKEKDIGGGLKWILLEFLNTCRTAI